MRQNQIQRRMRAVKIADAINNIEGVLVSGRTKELSTLWANGELSSSEMKKNSYRCSQKKLKRTLKKENKTQIH